MNGGAGGDATLGMNIFKSLKALAGDNDRIFVILDDREDLWQNSTDMSIPQNLLKIPAYYYHQVPGLTQRFAGMNKANFELSQSANLDITLLCYRDFLLSIHT